MKTLLFLLVSFMSYGQHVHLSLFDKRMDSLVICNRVKINPIVDNSIETFRVSKWFKLTLKTSINSDVISKLGSKTISLGEFETDDYLSIGKYDIRMKIYITKSFRFIFETVANGVDFNTYSYKSGFIIKF